MGLCSYYVLLAATAIGEKEEKTLTDRTKNDDNHMVDTPPETTAPLDPRIVAIVRFLARRATERDFAKAVATEAMQDRIDKDKEKKK